VTKDLFSIRLPTGWQVTEPSEEELATILADLAQRRAATGWRLDASVGAAGLDLVAVSSADEDASDNLNIRHVPLGARRVGDPEAFFAVFVPQMEILGFKVTEQQADLSTDDGLPMGRLAYSAIPANQGELEARGEQYYVLTETNLWVLTFTSAAVKLDRVPAEFEMSARTFAPR
jgi:hypothetical protein